MRYGFAGSGVFGLVVAACAVGPSYHRPDTGVPSEWRTTPVIADSLRPFYDSLGAHRDTLPLVPGAQAAAGPDTAGILPLQADSVADLGWFDLLADTVLRELVDSALTENRDVRVALATIDEFRALAGVARGELFPQVSLNGQAGRFKNVVVGTGSSRYNAIQITGNLQWELDFWGRIRRSTEAANSDLLGSAESRRAVVLSLVGDIATTYLTLRELDLSLEISRRTLASNLETLRLARQRFDQGVISELDVRRFESSVAGPAASVAQFEGQIAQTENLLSLLVGRNPGSIRRGRPLTEVLATLTVPEQLPESLLERRPDVRAAEAQLHSATARVGAAKGALFPTVVITGDYGTFGNRTSDLFHSQSEIYQILGGVSIPIFTGGRLGKQVDVAEARAEQARYGYEQSVLIALREVEDAIAGVRSSRNQAIAQQTQVDALRRALHLAELRYEAGASSYLDLLDAQRSLFVAELELAQAQGQEAIAAVALYRALGGGWPVSPADTVTTQ
ncbi:MAG TPA: efflux transporter outer membrane subunit [Gemmatimonadales bacterium]|nr:efflux transporter outer membrane subunit [Gemmatimonadales bacterium]